MSRFNANLAFTTQTGTQTYRFWLERYSQLHQVGGSASQSKWFQHYYTKSYSPGAISVEGRVPAQSDYDNLARFIRAHQEALVAAAGFSNTGTSQLPLMAMTILGEGMYVEGFIQSFQAGAKRFNPAPPVTFDFVVIKDAHSKNADIRAAYSLRTLWTGAFIDEGPISFGAVDPTTPTTGG